VQCGDAAKTYMNNVKREEIDAFSHSVNSLVHRLKHSWKAIAIPNATV